MIKLIQGDYLEEMNDMSNSSINMILTDPPYELSKSKGGGMMGKCGRKFMEEIRDADLIHGINILSFLDKCLSLFTHNQLFCGVFFCSTKQIIDYIQWAEINNLQYGIGVWHKSNPAPLCNYKYLNDVEYWIYIKGNKSKILGSYQSKSMVYKSQINKKDKKLYNHPTIKPVELIEKFIINHTEKHAVILDPFMGSGTTGVSCKNLNRSFIGIELDNVYFRTAYERIHNEPCWL